MKVRFLGFRKSDRDVNDPWFTIGNIYDVTENLEPRGLFVVSDDNEEDALFSGEYEVVEA